MLSKHYEIVKDAPKEISWDDYYNVSMDEFNELLQKYGDDEGVFQLFFERNPSFLPGGLELLGQSGHYPFMNTLITQPQIGGCFRRIPDFVWLAQDSLKFCPVFIEIEKPSKKTFNVQGYACADFTQAMSQIKEWKIILNNFVNIQMFYEYFNIPLDIRNKEFKPQFLLIYGRRAEYEENEKLVAMRNELQEENVVIMSYDRLKPLADYRQFITCKVSKKEYNVLNIAPTFRYRADCVGSLYHYKGFKEKIAVMQNTSDARKQFLMERYDYWMSYKGNMPGLVCGMEGE